MSSDIAIRVENISKCFQIYQQPQDRLKQSIYPRLQRFTKNQPKQYYKEFWALKDISFEIKKGETVGIIGQNGSGKSTLLQIICGTLNPTSGDLQANGRIGAMLELGSGFNPEFTGRENIYMNAAILGLSKTEIESRFNDILGFADIGDFIEQPVKTYSSGMMVRLAFAVIAHIDPDILIIDEALAVGDQIFVQKCMRFIRGFRERGTLIFVSHDTASVTNLCDSAIWINDGHIMEAGRVDGIVNAYNKFCHLKINHNAYEYEKPKTESQQSLNLETETIPVYPDGEFRMSVFENISNSDCWGAGKAKIDKVIFRSQENPNQVVFFGGENVELKIHASVLSKIDKPIIGFYFKDNRGQYLFGQNTYDDKASPISVNQDNKLIARFKFSLPLLYDGVYSLTAAIADGDPINHVQQHWIHNAALVKVESKQLRYGLMGIRFESITMQKI